MKIALLGSTGSIGQNTLLVCQQFGIEVEVLVAGNNIELLTKQIELFKPRIVVSAKEANLKAPVVLYGKEGIIKALELAQSEVVVNALVGFIGLHPTLKAIELGKRVALANKESLVVAGKFIDTAKIVPIDSEHFGLWYLLQQKSDFSKLWITASGGAFRNWAIEKIKDATFKDALCHPNWKMGPKITIDSASMVNKLFEVLEAFWLFKSKNIDALIETKSIIHAMVEFIDGSTILHASRADMRLPIAYALLGRVHKKILEPVDFIKLQSLEFRPITFERYPLWALRDTLLQKPELGVVLNGASEAAQELFRQDKISFGQMIEKIKATFEAFIDIKVDSLEDIFVIDKEVRNYVKSR